MILDMRLIKGDDIENDDLSIDFMISFSHFLKNFIGIKKQINKFDEFSWESSLNEKKKFNINHKTIGKKSYIYKWIAIPLGFIWTYTDFESNQITIWTHLLFKCNHWKVTVIITIIMMKRDTMYRESVIYHEHKIFPMIL